MLSRILKIFPWVVSFVLAGVLLMECRSGSRELVSEPFTKFKTVTPEPVKIIDSVKTERKVEAFKALPKEEKVEAYSEAITRREYKESFSDKEIEIDVEGVTTGTLDSLTVSYRKKQRTHFYLGGEIESNGVRLSTELKGFVVRPKTIYSFGYDFNNKAITAGIAFKIF
ncbi:hypothetical protein SAMN05192545_3932 [Maribacter dokdonensis]|uniref:Uncharacterized protein n=1 Tax=Maribacter dokdonensis TaxID=320912 RepID=A0ABY0V0P1_9FLAO|nr:hypothetical protein [Maribacter dokdonensis]SDT47397.1 hypothetical protein SAMN05192545_3932 [Maribacter dokdonensis]